MIRFDDPDTILEKEPMLNAPPQLQSANQELVRIVNGIHSRSGRSLRRSGILVSRSLSEQFFIA